MKKSKLRIVTSCLLSLAVTASILLGVAASSYVSAAPSTISGKLTEVNGFDLDGLRDQYLSDKVEDASRYSYDGDRWVIVEMEGESLYERYRKTKGYADFSAYCASEEGQTAKAEIEAKQTAFREALDIAEIAYTYKYSYSTLNNGLALRVKAEDCKKISLRDGVKDVYFSERYAVPKVAVSNNANVYSTGIYNATGISYKGEGMVVAILDTGLDHTHEAFAVMPTSPAWDKATVAAKMAASGIFSIRASADEVYYNAKIPFAYDYADDDADVFPQYSSHGTHVAGIVAGKSDYVVNKETGETFLGVAPEAQLVIAKVFTDNLDNEALGGANSIDILAAVSDCVELGVDVINMSLGSSAGFSDEKSDTFTNEVYERVREAGISLVVAASNDYSSGFGGGNGTNLASNPDSGTVGAPSTYPAALSVASINGQKASYVFANDDEDQVAFINEASDENGNSYDFVAQLYALANKAKGEELRYKYVVVGGVGRATNYTAQVKRELKNKDGYDGTIALVRRGDTTFAEKVQTAMDNGADACIIYNNLSGTIRMSLGEVDDPIPTCSISMDAGKTLVENARRSVGSLTVSSSLKAGPFMSDFSSWGPTPSLQLRPEITAHGGEITSAVAGGYDIYSGTSMAAPNMAGAIALLRQHFKETTELAGTALNSRVNQVLMSTATIALNEEGNPYSPRKQGAGLAGIKAAIEAEGYLTVKGADGNLLDKTKIELYDDKTKKGIYEFSFLVNNITDKTTTYTPTAYVMTETLATDGKTVAEKAYMLSDSTVVYQVNGAPLDGAITVPAGGSVEVSVKITLGAEGRRYLNESFENGMYVEGFVSLAAGENAEVTLGLPYLAFYGDWNDAPLFDYSEYELAESQKDTGVAPEDKLVASAASTRIFGRYYGNRYVLPMGSYIYTIDESDVQIYPDPEKIALSMFDTEGNHTIYELYMVYAGLLRGAAYMNIEIKDTATGDVIFSQTQENVSKSYAAGGSNQGSAIMLEIKPSEWNLVNNGNYTVSLKGQLDYEGGENPDRGSFDFQFTVDYEAPRATEYRIRYEAYTENKQTKYRIYLDVDVFDNQYVQDIMPCYIREDETGANTLTLITDLPIPVYGEKGKESTVTFEITDIYEEYVKTGKLYIGVEDYAMNQSLFLVDVPTALGEIESITPAEDAYLKKTGIVKENTNEEKTPYSVYELTLAPNQYYKPTLLAPTESSIVHNLTWRVTEGELALLTKNEELFVPADSAGKTATLQLVYESNDETRIYAEVGLRVEGEEKTLPSPDRLTLAPVTDGFHRVVDINTTGAVDLYPNMQITLAASPSPWYITGLTYTYISSNSEVASVDETGAVTTHKKGTAYITVTAEGYDRLKKTVKITVDSEFRVSSYTLLNYYGGPECVVPDDLNISTIDEECFRYNTTLRRVVLPKSLTVIPEGAFLGCENLEEVVIPSQCTTVGNYAFDGCKKLTKITFARFADREGTVLEEFAGTITVGRAAFRGCSALTTIENEKRMTAIHESAFEGCTSLTAIDLTELRSAGKNAFAKCTALTEITLGVNSAVGEGMFSGCSALTEIYYPCASLAANAFNGCKKLTSITFSDTGLVSFGERALANTGLREILLPNGTYTLGAGAFTGCSRLTTVTLSAGTRLVSGTENPFDGCRTFTAFAVSADNTAYTALDGILYNRSVTELIAVPYGKESLGTIPATVTSLATGALAGCRSLTSFDLTGYTSIGSYAFAGSSVTSVTLPADLTEIPDGLFSGCAKLTELIGGASVTRVGDSAFASCLKLGALSLPALTEVGSNAFRSAALTSLDAPLLREVGAQAFERSSLQTVNFPALSVIGTAAFYGMPSLTTAVLGPVTQMGARAFAASPRLASVSFAEGTELIGNYAFYAQGTTSVLTSVTLPSTVKSIGRYAFAATPITEICLSGVQTVGNAAFTSCKSLTAVDLSSALTVGEYAFADTGLTTLSLPACTAVGDYAFYRTVSLTSVDFGALHSVGAYAFYGTRLVTLTLPATFTERSYDYTWSILDEKGRVKETKTRKVAAYGNAAFAAIPTLTEIRISATDGDFFVMDGVLYAKAEDGYLLVQYPAARAGRDYLVADGTVAIGASAFEGTQSLVSVEFPYTLRRIGQYAFYNPEGESFVKSFTFNSVEAPILLAEYVSGEEFDSNSILSVIFGDSSTGQALGSSIYYANFRDFVAQRMYDDIFNPEYYQSEDFGLSLTVPKNGIGYDTEIWKSFFGDIQVTSEILPDNTTHGAFDAIDEMKKTPLADITGAESLAALEAISEKVLAARRAYNKVTLTDQLTLCRDRYETLLAYESALRSTKASLGSPVSVEKLVLSSIPSKIRYEAGESFDPTGMVIKAIFADESELVLSAGEYTLDRTVLREEDEEVVISYVDRGNTYTVSVKVNVQASQKTEPTALPTPSVTLSESGLASWESVTGAVAYLYRIDGGEEVRTTETSVQLTNGQSITVKAVGDGTASADSVYSESVTYTAKSDAAAPDTSKGGLPTYAIVLIAVGSTAILAGGAFLVWYFLVKKKRGW